MKAIIFEKYGPPDVLQVKEIDKPIPKDNEILIKVKAASVNALDWHLMRGTPFIARIGRGFLRPVKKRLGADFSGVVEEVGENVWDFMPGEDVFGDMYPDPCAFAEYVVIAQDGIIESKPDNVTFEEAAATPAAGVTALQALKNHGKIQAGQNVLINGSSGAVGTFTVQMAKAFGAHVTAVCSLPNTELVQQLGAEKVIDYNQEDFTQTDQQYDLIIDNVGNRSVSDLKRALKPGGICVIVGYTSFALLLQHTLLSPILSGAGKIILMGAAKPNSNDLNTLREMLESGKIKAVIEKRYPLNETAEAIRYLEKGHARAKIVIDI